MEGAGEGVGAAGVGGEEVREAAAVVKVHSSKGSNKISSGGGESGVKITTLQHL